MIVAVQTRLLDRLGSKHAIRSRTQRSRRKKRPLLLRLGDANQLLKEMGSHSEHSELFKKLAESLVLKFANLERLSTSAARSKEGRASIHKILLETDELLGSIDLPSILRPIPSNVDSWSGNSREVLIEKLKKLGQIVPAARDLIRVARRHSIFRSIDVEELKTFPDGQQCAEPTSVQDGFLRRCMIDENRTKTNGNLQILESRLSKTSQEIIGCIEDHTRREKRVHAEIQLLLFYEKHPDIERRPRVLCSSKHACFLCDLFIKTHKGFYMPGSHGKFYPQWRLPTLEELNLPKETTKKYLKCLEDFNENLELKIYDYLQKGPVQIPDPTESIIYKPGSITPSVASKATKIEVGQQQEHSSNPRDTTLALELFEPRESLQIPVPSETAMPPSFTRGSPATIQSLDAPPDALVASTSPIARPSSSDSGSSATVMASGPTFNDPDKLYRMSFRTPVSVALLPGSSARFHTSRIHMELSYDDASSLASSTLSSASTAEAPDSVIKVWVEWVDSASCPTETLFDLSMQWTCKNVSGENAFGGLGFGLRKGDEILVMRAIPGTESV